MSVCNEVLRRIADCTHYCGVLMTSFRRDIWTFVRNIVCMAGLSEKERERESVSVCVSNPELMDQ